MRLFNIFFVSLLLLAGCRDNTTVPGQVGSGSPQDSGYTFLALGDSYTFGQSVSADERWPVLMVKSLKNNGKIFKSPDIRATTGWTTSDLLNSLEGNEPVHNYDLVSLMIGVNNQFQGRSINEYRTEFRQLLTKSIGYAGGDKQKVFVLSIPDWGTTPYGESNRDQIAVEIDQFNTVASDECKKQGVVFVDITPISRTALNDLSLLAFDRLHYSAKMHQLWVDKAILEIRSRI